MAWVFPFFSPTHPTARRPLPLQVMAVIASLGDLAGMFALPCLFALRLLRLHPAERSACIALAAGSLALSGCGVFSSVQQLIAAWHDKHGGGGGGGAAAIQLLPAPWRWALSAASS